METAVIRTGHELSETEKIAVVRYLQDNLVNGKLARGAFGYAASHFNVNRVTVSKVWKAFTTTGNVKSRKPGRVTIRDMSEASGLSMGTSPRSLKSGRLQRKSSRLKPLLTDANKLQRIWFCSSHVQRYAPSLLAQATGQAGELDDFEFTNMWDVVHLTKREIPRRRSCKSKQFLPKVMFLPPLHVLDGILSATLTSTEKSGYDSSWSKYPQRETHATVAYLRHEQGHFCDQGEVSSTDGWTFAVSWQPPNSLPT